MLLCMALTSLNDYKAFAGITGTDATRDASLNAILSSVEAAIKKLCRPYQFESGTSTDYILDAPIDPWLSLPLVPVRSITSLYLNFDADGDPDAFTSDHLLTEFDDYRLQIDMTVEGWSRSGLVERIAAANWGGVYVKPVTRLARDGQLDPTRGAIKVTYTYGLTSVPDDVKEAVHLATSMIYGRRERGYPVASESWNGYSASAAGPFVATAVVQSGDVINLLLPYMKMFCGRV